MDLGLLYQALKQKQVDMVAGNATDGLISAMGLTVLRDDKSYFPPYEAAVAVRSVALDSRPGLRAALAELSGKNLDGVDAQHELSSGWAAPRGTRSRSGIPGSKVVSQPSVEMSVWTKAWRTHSCVPRRGYIPGT